MDSSYRKPLEKGGHGSCHITIQPPNIEVQRIEEDFNSYFTKIRRKFDNIFQV